VVQITPVQVQYGRAAVGTVEQEPRLTLTIFGDLLLATDFVEVRQID